MQRSIIPIVAIPLLVPWLAIIGIALSPPAAAADLDLVFLIDTTGSMSNEIREAKSRVHDIAAALRAKRPGELVRMGVVAYRDQGDDYVTRISPLAHAEEKTFRFLSDLSADGGGDGPEDVLAGLAAALEKMEWREGTGADRLIFLIGDAPPHLDYEDGPRPEALIELARRKRIVVNTIGCRSLPASGREFFQTFAYATEGRYQHIGSARADEPSLGEALLQAANPAQTAELERGEPIRARFERSRPSSVTRELLVRLLAQGPDRKGAMGCAVLEIVLPEGIRLSAEPRLTSRSKSLDVEIDLEEEPHAAASSRGGTLSTFHLDPCVPATTPVRVIPGGRS